MILGNFKEFFLVFSGLVFLSSILVYLILFVLKFKRIVRAFKGIPKWFVLINSVILTYKLFFIPKIIFRENFGIWVLSMAKSETMTTVLLNQRSPVYFFIIKVFDSLFDGVGVIFISNFNIILSFLTSFLIYYIVLVLLKDKLIAGLSGLFYALSLPVFIHSMTEGYTTPALFFAIGALFFISLYIKEKQYPFLFLGITSSYLAVGSRPEYIIFDLIFLVFIYIFVKKIRLKHYLIYLIFFLPKFFVALNMYFENITTDEFLIGKTFTYSGFIDFVNNIFVYRIQDFLIDLDRSLVSLANPFSLMGVFLVFALLFIFNWKRTNNKSKKVFLFFVFYYLIFFLYYSFLHRDGINGSFKYLCSLVLPISVMAAMGLRTFLGEKQKRYYFFILVFLIYSFWMGSPLTYGMYPNFDPRISDAKIFVVFDNYHINTYLRPDSFAFNEWNKYRSAVIDNDDLNKTASILNIFSKNENQDKIFIANGFRSFLYSMPVGGKIYTPTKFQELKYILEEIKANDIVYVSQGILGFQKDNNHRISYFAAISPDIFEKYIKEELFLEQEIISYYENDHHVFLYKMIKKDE